MNIIAITQARMGSSRFPGKILKKILNKTLLEIHLERILHSKMIDKLIVATTNKSIDDPLIDVLKDKNLNIYRGSENDVLDRFYKTALEYNPYYLVRLTSDCPLIDPILIDEVIKYSLQNDLDYCSNTLVQNYPDGQDIEVVKFSSLINAWENATLSSDREHVTPYIWKNSTFKGESKFRSDNYFNLDRSFGHLRMTVDEEVDYLVIESLCDKLGFDKTWLEYALELEKNDQIRKLNENIIRNEGYNSSILNE